MKYKNKKNKKVLCLHNNTSIILLDFYLNEAYFKYTSEFEKAIF